MCKGGGFSNKEDEEAKIDAAQLLASLSLRKAEPFVGVVVKFLMEKEENGEVYRANFDKFIDLSTFAPIKEVSIMAERLDIADVVINLKNKKLILELI